MEHAIHEALMATSAASAVLWTGTLIVTQLADSNRGASQEQGSLSPERPPWRYVQFAARPKSREFRTQAEVLSVASLAMLGFGIIAPIFALFLDGLWLRLTALLFAAIYSKITYSEAAFAVQVLRGRATVRADAPDPELYKKAILCYITEEVAQFLAMVAIIVFPNIMLVLVLSIAFMYVGYQGALGRYLMNRRPFEP